MVVLTGARQTGKTATFRRLLPNLHEGMENLDVDIRLVFA